MWILVNVGGYAREEGENLRVAFELRRLGPCEDDAQRGEEALELGYA